MTKAHRDTPSQRSAPSKSGAAQKPQRSVGWVVSITLIGWIVLATPVAAMGVLTYLLFFSASGDSNQAWIIVQGVLSAAMGLCMIAFPVLLGFAVMKRRRGLWIGAIVTGALSVATLIYVSGSIFGPPTVSG
ncbi:hypothetical protein [Arthrobacter sp. GMC3]|uniref:hypothetical protein n=1 Tax=Arthrobacter sp. GMC3 TaxID=2058894 RepID=UPI000CE490DC|nr:hypothetical protein [Arthrobacter sp. GMC3]